MVALASNPLLKLLERGIVPGARGAFVLRTLLAIGLALYGALALQLSSPGSAAVTVIIVSGMSRGGLISKGLWRIFGTFVGAIATISIFAALAQATLLFLAVIACWLGVCAYVSGILRHFRSYSAVLAGYTVAIITAGALNDPAHVLEVALSRISVVVLGVVSSTAVAMVFQLETSIGSVRADLSKAVQGVAGILIDRNTQDEARLADQLFALSAMLDRLGGSIEFAGVESPTIARLSGIWCRGVAALHAAVLSTELTRQALLRLERASGLHDRRISDWIGAVDEALRALMTWQPAHREATTVLAERFHALSKVADQLILSASGATEIDLVLVQQGLDHLIWSLEHVDIVDCGNPFSDPARPVMTFRDHRVASRNGCRTAIVVMLTGIFCYATAWTASPTCIGTVASLTALLAAAPNASAASVEFLKGAILASIAAYICEFMLLNGADGFAMLFLSMMPFLAAGIYASTVPKYNPLSFGYVVLFITQLSIANVMKYNVVAFLNGAEAYVLSGLMMILVFKLVLPPNLERDCQYLLARLRGLARQWAAKPVAHQQDWLGWQVTFLQGVCLLIARVKRIDPHLGEQVLHDSGALILLTSEVARLRFLLAADDFPAEGSEICRQRLAQLQDLREPDTVRNNFDSAALQLGSFADDDPAMRQKLAMASSRLRAIASLIGPAARLTFAASDGRAIAAAALARA